VEAEGARPNLAASSFPFLSFPVGQCPSLTLTAGTCSSRSSPCGPSSSARYGSRQAAARHASPATAAAQQVKEFKSKGGGSGDRPAGPGRRQDAR